MIPGVINLAALNQEFQIYNSDDDRSLTYQDLTGFTQHWKAILWERHHMRTGNTIGIGFPLTDIYYIGLVMAACELGLQLVVLDISNSHVINTANPKVQEFMPMDLFVAGRNLSPDKAKYYAGLARRSDDWQSWDTYQVQDTNTWQDIQHSVCSPDDVLLLCTSSGTTDRPKRVQHTHEFLWSVSQRNQKLWQFKGNVVHVRNLHHGSSLATYFLPALMSPSCQQHFVYNLESEAQLDSLAEFCARHDINHCQLPYVGYVRAFVESARQQRLRFCDLTIYTLGYIDPACQASLLEIGTVRIVSVFGCNETSGPIFVNTLQHDSVQFDPQLFMRCDEFYGLDINTDGQLAVTLPVYEGRTVIMQDAFDVQQNQYRHLGRNDLVRIHDQEFDLFWLLALADSVDIKAQVVIDRLRERLYLAVWDRDTDLHEATTTINQQLQHRYGRDFSIAHSQHLAQPDFMFGIKLDHEMLRQHFRSQYASTS